MGEAKKRDIILELILNMPKLNGFIDSDIFDRFEGTGVLWGDIINAQLIKTIRELIKHLTNIERRG